MTTPSITLPEAQSRSQEVNPQRIGRSAQEFESLLIAQMLRAARSSSGGGWLGSGDDQAGQSMVELGEEHLAQLLAARGGLGLARLITESLGDSGRQTGEGV